MGDSGVKIGLLWDDWLQRREIRQRSTITTQQKCKQTTVWTFQATNKQNFTQEYLDITKRKKPLERKWIFS